MNALASTSIAASGIGLGLAISDKNEPEYTLNSTRHRTRVCRRRTPTWKEIIAEFARKEDAELFLRALAGYL